MKSSRESAAQFFCYSNAESDRLQALRSFNILDTPPEANFDELVNLAAAICRVPISLITLVDEHRTWVKSGTGLSCSSVPRELSFCNHAAQERDLFVVRDASRDKRFANHPFVTGEPHIRFYAGMPLTTPDGHSIGVLCVADRRPRRLSADQKLALRVLAQQAMTQLQLHKQMRSVETMLETSKELAARLSASEEMFRAFMDNSPVMGFLKDEEGRMVYYNKVLADIYGASQTAWLGKSDAELWPAEMAASFRAHDAAVLASRTTLQVDETIPRPGGGTLRVKSYKFPFTDAQGRLFLAGMALDVTKEREAEEELKHYQAQLQQANEKLRELSFTDGLTGVGNRRAFEAGLAREIDRCKRMELPISLLMLDVDDFKAFNDNFGHGQGDEVLRRVGVVLLCGARSTDLAARYGGEEFALVLPETTEAAALQIAERIRGAIAALPWRERQITVSIGVGALPAGSAESHLLVQAADQALYLAKRGGKNRCSRAQEGSSLSSAGQLPTTVAATREACAMLQ